MGLKYLLVSLILTPACSETKEYHELKKAELNAAEIQLKPEPGSYSFGPVVQFIHEGDGLLEYETKRGTWALMGPCSLDLPDEPLGSDCITVDRSMTIKYRVNFGDIVSETRTATYKISNEQRDFSVNDIDFEETETICELFDFGGKTRLEVRIQGKNDEAIGANKLAWFTATYHDVSKLNESVEVTDYTAGLSIGGSGDRPFGVPDYSPSKFNGGSCALQLEQFEAGGKASGTATCSELKSIKPTTALGETIEVKALKWQCDQWR